MFFRLIDCAIPTASTMDQSTQTGTNQTGVLYTMICKNKCGYCSTKEIFDQVLRVATVTEGAKRQVDGRMDRQAGGQTDSQAVRQSDRQAGKQTDSQAVRQTDSQTADKQIARRADKQIGRLL